MSNTAEIAIELHNIPLDNDDNNNNYTNNTNNNDNDINNKLFTDLSKITLCIDKALNSKIEDKNNDDIDNNKTALKSSITADKSSISTDIRLDDNINNVTIILSDSDIEVCEKSENRQSSGTFNSSTSEIGKANIYSNQTAEKQRIEQYYEEYHRKWG
eukprot:Pgem_evm1s7472